MSSHSAPQVEKRRQHKEQRNKLSQPPRSVLVNDPKTHRNLILIFVVRESNGLTEGDRAPANQRLK